MNSSKVLIFFFLLIAIVNAVPVPGWLFGRLNKKDNNNEGNPFENFFKNAFGKNKNNDQQEEQKEMVPLDEMVKDTLENITNDALNNVSIIIKNALINEFKKHNQSNPTNDAIVDAISDNIDLINEAVGGVVVREIENGNLEKIAKEGAKNVTDVVNKEIIPNLDNLFKGNNFEKFAQEAINNVNKSVQEFIQKSLETSRAVVDQALNNGFNELVSDAASKKDIPSMVTDGISFLIKNNLCNSLGDDFDDVCETVANSIIVSTSGIINDIIRSSINAMSGNTISVACAVIPSEIFKSLTNAVITTVGSQINNITHNDDEVAIKIANNVMNIVINTVDHLLCGNKSKLDKSGNAVFKDVNELTESITKKVEKIDNGNNRDIIASDIIDIQNSIETVEKKAESADEKNAYKPVNQPVEINLDKETVKKIVDKALELKSSANGEVINVKSGDEMTPIVFYVVVNNNDN